VTDLFALAIKSSCDLPDFLFKRMLEFGRPPLVRFTGPPGYPPLPTVAALSGLSRTRKLDEAGAGDVDSEGRSRTFPDDLRRAKFLSGFLGM